MVVITKWHTLVAALWISLGCGYWGTFGTFSPALSKRYDLGAGDISTIGIGTTVVGFVTFTCGLYTDGVGITISLLTGAFINMLGWFLYGFLAINDLQPMSPVVMFTSLGIFATYGAGMLTSVVFKVIANNFGTEDRSSVIGIAKAWVGVTSGFASTLYVGFFPSADDAPERLYFAWFICVNIAVFVLLPAPLMRIVDKNLLGNLALSPRSRMAYLLAITLTLIALTVAVALAEGGLTHSITKAFSVVLLSLALLPWLSLLPSRGSLSESLMEDTPAVQQPEAQHPPSPWACGPWEMVKRPDAWLLWICVFSLMAGGVTLTTNFGNITQSRSGPHVSSATAVSLFSASQALGRLSGGVISDVLVRWRWPRPSYFVVLGVGMAAGHACLCFPGPAMLYVGVLLAGYTFGSCYPLMIVTIVELYGAERIASNYMIFDGTPVGVASLVFGKAISQWVYQRHATGDTCIGDDCFTLAYIAVIVLQIFAIVFACLLSLRSAVVYRTSVFTTLPSAEMTSPCGA